MFYCRSYGIWLELRCFRKVTPATIVYVHATPSRLAKASWSRSGCPLPQEPLACISCGVEQSLIALEARGKHSGDKDEAALDAERDHLDSER